MRSSISGIFFLFLFGLPSSTAICQTEKKSPPHLSGFVDFNFYYDTREFSVLTYNILANLPKRFQYFSLTNYQSSNESFDLNSVYAEHNVRWALHKSKPIDLTLQYVMRGGDDNDDFRLGFR